MRIIRKNDMAISETELSAMTAGLDTLHKETFPEVTKTLDDAAANMSRLMSSNGLGRRGFLAGVGGIAVVGGLAACSSSGGSSPSNPPASATGGTTGGTSGGASKYTGDLKVVALAAALENLAVAAYGLVLSNAGKNKYGTVPPAIAQFATVAMQQHMDHAGAWNSVLTKNNLPAVKDASKLSITSGAVSKLSAATKLTDVATQALGLETAAAETYIFATANVKDPTGIAVAATIAPVETAHIAILNFVLGTYPVPNSDIGTTNAVMPNAFTG